MKHSVYGSSISYFTGKVENYFRLRRIPHEFFPMQFPKDRKSLKSELGVIQMPSIKLSDGRWQTDSTKIIQWFESQLPKPGIVPDDPVKAFICYLIEDWADEWWWRPAMHYRWHYDIGASFASNHLSKELLHSVPLPRFIKRYYLTKRQRLGYTTGDGISRKNVKQIETQVRELFSHLENIFKKRPFFFGDRPSLADIGLSGPFFRHFALDPVPAGILKREAPSVLEWSTRLWNASLDDLSNEWTDDIPEDISPLIKSIGLHYLPYLNANAECVRLNKRKFSPQIGGVVYKNARASKYRVWCLNELRLRFLNNSENARQKIESYLRLHDCWEPLWAINTLPCSFNQEKALPFKAKFKMVDFDQ
ncbi:glutathione S-transferase family protein [Glaciecola petra]|uniref:Glutathione S-transferase family protein n=1 Tax=Glaciecola petra TaxID=3075602 RepID=A0ABU2ZW49_9ALTE|nr:glutathione S-transferase family protein [Aestuariibacter sp. P117]MDT0596471.1 glutathione S-transferase family protein [Aestuariibacter sp. P117]